MWAQIWQGGLLDPAFRWIKRYEGCWVKKNKANLWTQIRKGGSPDAAFTWTLDNKVKG
jgi:hypothetical protein